jgi:hypothetical protein
MPRSQRRRALDRRENVITRPLTIQPDLIVAQTRHLDRLLPAAAVADRRGQ